jgi:hypothetical protein
MDGQQNPMKPNRPAQVEVVPDLDSFFYKELNGILGQQHLVVRQQTLDYMVNLLTLFARSEEFFDTTPDGLRLKSLAEMLSETLELETEAKRNAILQRLGDISLFVAGFLSRGFSHSEIDVDYHIAMGGRAYDTLARSQPGRQGNLAQVFSELAGKFQPLVDVLNELSDAAYTYSHRDILRLYETWLKTGSRRSRRLLMELGIDATPVGLRLQ